MTINVTERYAMGWSDARSIFGNKQAFVAETIAGPHNLVRVQFIDPADPPRGPLHIVFQLAQTGDNTRYIDVMDASSQTLVHGRQARKPGGGSGASRREAAQWMLDVAGARYGCEVSDLDKWI